LNLNSVGKTNSIYNNNKTDKSNNQRQSSPNFKGLIDLPGVVMSGIENGGFIASFLVQDTLGMTLPRSGEGLIRGIDKDRIRATKNCVKAKLGFGKATEEDKAKCLHLKDLNFKEGSEVLIREGLSGPFMMFTPVLVLLGAKKVAGRSTFTNSAMIKRLGQTMTDLVGETTHRSKDALKEAFYRKNVEKMVQATTGATDKAAEAEFIDKAVESMERLDNYAAQMKNATCKAKKGLKKDMAEEQKNLLDSFNQFHRTHSSDYDMVNRSKLDGEVFSTEKTINGIRDYAHDVLKNKEVSEITAEHTKSIENKSLVKRAVINIAAALSTVGSLSIVPMLYKLVNPVPPGALGDPKTADEKLMAAKNNANAPKAENNKGNVSFTGKYDKFVKYFEFNGNQLTPALMLSLAGGGLMAPRVATAANRAPENPVTNKKDYSEIPEIITRDVVSTGAVTFGVPMLSKLLVNSYADKTGFVLQNKLEKPLTGVKKVLDMLNPFSKVNPYQIKDLDQMYGNLDTPEKLGTFTEFIDKNGGNLAKILKTEERTNEVFEDFGLNLKELAKGDRNAANATIKEKLASEAGFAERLIEAIKPEPKKPGLFTRAYRSVKKTICEKTGKEYKEVAKEAPNKLLKRARSLNSVTSFAATVFLVPAFLGMVLPKMVYGMTARRQKKLAEATQKALAEKNNLAQAQNTSENKSDEKSKVDFSKLNKNIAKSQTFTQMRHFS